MINLLAKKIMPCLQKIFLTLLPWQTVYIVTNLGKPFESIIIHASALLLLIILIMAMIIHRPKISLVKASLVLGLVIMQISLAQNVWLAIQQSAWLGLGMFWWWLLTKHHITKTELVIWLSVGAIIPASLGIYQFFSQSSLTSAWLGLSFISPDSIGSPVIVNETGRWLRAFGTFPHPNMFGGYLVGIIILIITEAVQPAGRKQWMWFGLLILFTSALVLTFSRSAGLVWILFILFFHYQIFSSARATKLAMPVFVSVLTAFCLMTITWPIWAGRFGQGAVSVNETAAITERISGANRAVQVIKNQPWWGVGPGNFTLNLVATAPELKNWEIAPVHNVPLLVLAEWGLLVGALLLLVVGLYVGPYALFLAPIWLFDHYLYSQWPGILVAIILILSTVYTHHCLTEPKK